MKVSPAAATVVGMAFGAALGCLVAFPSFDRSSCVLWLFLAFTGGPWGYILWLTSDRARSERFQRVVNVFAIVAIAGMLLAFPNFWWRTGGIGGAFVICILGGICGASMLVVGTGWAFIHLFGHLASLLHHDRKVIEGNSFAGLWDPELDHDRQPGKES